MNITLRLCYERDGERPRRRSCQLRLGHPPYFRGGGQENLERGPLADLAIDGNRSVHPLNHMLYDGEAQAGASDLAERALSTR